MGCLLFHSITFTKTEKGILLNLSPFGDVPCSLFRSFHLWLSTTRFKGFNYERKHVSSFNKELKVQTSAVGLSSFLAPSPFLTAVGFAPAGPCVRCGNASWPLAGCVPWLPKGGAMRSWCGPPCAGAAKMQYQGIAWELKCHDLQKFLRGLIEVYKLI